MKTVFYYYRLFSLDIIAGALASCLFAFKIIDVPASIPLFIVLGISVFSIYSFDHIVDGIRKEGFTDTGSHRFFFVHRKVLIGIVILAVMAGISLAVIFLDKEIIKFGIFVGIFLIVYFLFNQTKNTAWQKMFFKEFWIAVIYTLVIWGLPIIENSYLVEIPAILMAISFGFLVLGNVLIYSYYGFISDGLEREKSIAIQFGRKKSRMFIILALCFSADALLAELIFFHLFRSIDYTVLILMNFGLMLIIYQKDKFEKNNLYGVLADALFLLPVLSVLI